MGEGLQRAKRLAEATRYPTPQTASKFRDKNNQLRVVRVIGVLAHEGLVRVIGVLAHEGLIRIQNTISGKETDVSFKTLYTRFELVRE